VRHFTAEAKNGESISVELDRLVNTVKDASTRKVRFQMPFLFRLEISLGIIVIHH